MNTHRITTGDQDMATDSNARLLYYRDNPNGVVLALPHNSLVLASIVSGILHTPSHVFLAQTLRAPCRCPCAIGALTEANAVHMDESVIVRQQWPYRELRAYIEREMQTQRSEIARQRQIHRPGRGLPSLIERLVLFVNDGSAASATLIASIKSFRDLGAAKIVVALPSDSFQLIREIEYRVDELIAVAPSSFTGHVSTGLNASIHTPWVA